MRLLTKTGLCSFLIAFLMVLVISPVALAATSPSLGTAGSFSILSSSYANTVSGTTINGDLGYTTGPATAPTVNGTTHVADSTYTQAGIAQGSALSALASQTCDFSFAPGAVDLAIDTTHGPVGTYTPGVYCISGAASIGTAGITLNGSGTYIFRSTGALTTAANSVVSLAGGASTCDLWWTPAAATTLGANSTFAGTDIDAAGITIGNLVTWEGRALAFGGTVSTSRNTITAPSTCPGPTNPPSTPTGPGSGTPNAGTGAGIGSSSASSTPGLPNAGNGPSHTNITKQLVPIIALTILGGAYLMRKKIAHSF